MVVFPNIKVNLGLYITGKRPDGYHNIESVFYPVAWREALEITDRNDKAWPNPGIAPGMIQSKHEVGGIRFMSYGVPIPGEAADNLCIKVYQRLEEWFHLPSIDMHLLKSLPIGAGLGGGSADAAFALRALKDFFDLRISDHEAMELLADIGSDCPFFWKNKPMFVFGRGVNMRPIDLDLSNYYIVLVNPGVHVSTKEAYAGVHPSPAPFDLNLLPHIDVADWKEVVVNDFEKSVFALHPQLAEVKQSLYDQGALYAAMTGSGSTLFGIFETPQLNREAWRSFTCWTGQLTLPS